jgi:tripartite-type tricarboxylate transporter receptor subunit TctC
MHTRILCLGSFVALATMVATPAAQSGAWPERPVRIIVPFAAGGHSDGIARIVAERLSDRLGQVVVENRPGAAGVIAAETVARAPADGYTLFMGSPSQIAITPALTKTPYDPVKDFAPITNIGEGPFVLAIHPGMAVNSIGEFIERVRREPGKFTYVSSGVNGMVHLSTGLFLRRAGLNMTPVTYKGGTAPVADLIAGHVTAYLAIMSVALPHAPSGALKLLAVTSEKRVPQAPGIPTFIESGLSGFKLVTWNGLMAPSGTPRAVVERIANEVVRSLKEPDFIERLAKFGVEPVGNSPEEFAAQIAADIALWTEAIKLAGGREK